MFKSHSKEQIEKFIQEFCKTDLLILFLSALKTESYHFAGILKREIQNRHFSEAELLAIRESGFNGRLNGLFE
jgi:hypothetical protein